MPGTVQSIESTAEGKTDTTLHSLEGSYLLMKDGRLQIRQQITIGGIYSMLDDRERYGENQEDKGMRSRGVGRNCK